MWKRDLSGRRETAGFVLSYLVGGCNGGPASSCREKSEVDFTTHPLESSQGESGLKLRL